MIPKETKGFYLKNIIKNKSTFSEMYCIHKILIKIVNLKLKLEKRTIEMYRLSCILLRKNSFSLFRLGCYEENRVPRIKKVY